MNGEMIPPAQGGFFKKAPVQDPITGDIMNQVRDISRRLRIIEERYSNLRKNIQVNEQNMLTDQRKVNADLKAVTSEITEMKRAFMEIKEEMRLMVAEVREAVKKEELKVLEKYVNLWEPLNFVTHAEVGKLIDLHLEKREKNG